MRGVTVAPGAHDDAPPLLDDLMPWSVAPLRFGRSWIVAPAAPLTANLALSDPGR